MGEHEAYARGHELLQNLVRGDAALGLVADLETHQRTMTTCLWQAAEAGVAAAFRDLSDCYAARLVPLGAFDGVGPESAESKRWSEQALVFVDPEPSRELTLRCLAEALRLGDRTALRSLVRWSHDSGAENKKHVLRLLLEQKEPTPAELHQLGLLQHWLGDAEGSAKTHERAAELGNADAQFELYVFYAQGIGVQPNAKSANHWLQRAAEGGQSRALYNLGAAFATGTSGERDLERAADFYRRAAEQGNGRAAANIAVMVLSGELDGPDEEAIRMLDWADDLGFPSREMLDAVGLDDPRETSS
jgi:TPR repeat protein